MESTSGAPTPSSPATPGAPGSKSFVLRVSIPSRNANKAMMVQTTDSVGSVIQQLEEKLGNAVDEDGNSGYWNYGLYDLPKNGKNGKYLEEKREIGHYNLEANTVLEFKEKGKVYPPGTDIAAVLAANKKMQKKFMEEVKNGFIDRVREFGAKQMDPNFHAEDGSTPLSVAILNDDRAMMLALFELGAFVDYRVRDAWKTPLHVAASARKLIALATLIAFNANVNTQDVAGQTPITVAAATGNFDCVRMLLESRADPEIRDNNHRAPLHVACMKSQDQIARLLIDYGAEMNVTNNVGNTPLHVAASACSTECVRWLLIRGASTNLVNKSGHTALQVATIANLSQVVDLIQNFTPEQQIPAPPKPRWDQGESSQSNKLARASRFPAQGHADAPITELGSTVQSPDAQTPVAKLNLLGLSPTATDGTLNPSQRKRMKIPPPPSEPKPLQPSSLEALSVNPTDQSVKPALVY